MYRIRVILVGVTATCIVAGLGLWVYLSGLLGGAPAAPMVVYPPGPESLLLQTANFDTGYGEDEVPMLLDEFRQACRQACRELIGDTRLTEPLADSFTAAAVDRLQLYLTPSYERYREYGRRVAGRDPEGVKVVNVLSNQEAFEKSTVGLRLLPFDSRAAVVRCLFLRGAEIQSDMTSRFTYVVDSGLFFSKVGHEPKKSRATVYEVIVPVEAPDSFNPGKTIPLVLGMDFVWDTSTRTWKPWRMGYYDPSGVERRIVPPWF